MLIKEFGTPDKPVLVLIHGGGLSWWTWQKHIDQLKDNFLIKAVIIDGHGEDYQTDFISIEDTAAKLIAYIKSHHEGAVHGICGLSLGAQIIVEMLSSEPNLSDNWLIESALIKPLGLTLKLIEPTIPLMYPLIKKRWFAKLQAKSLAINEAQFEDYFIDSSKMSLTSLRAITASNGSYTLKPKEIITNKNVLIYVGSKEPKIMIESAKILNDRIPNSKLKIMQGFKHGELSLNMVDEYLKIITGFPFQSSQ